MNVELSNSGSGEIMVHAIESLDVDLNGSGNLVYTGGPQVNIESHRSGDVYRK